jgi:p-aminobenzoyl-glutamate transporter AbgT
LSIMAPYVVVCTLVWCALFYIFYAFDLPIGPGIHPRMSH